MKTEQEQEESRLGTTTFPYYRSHKVVEAAKIVAVHRKPGLPPKLVLELPDGKRIHLSVDLTYMEKHNPQVGGFWMRYPDGYQSWSPAKAFVDGYSIVGPGYGGTTTTGTRM